MFAFDKTILKLLHYSGAASMLAPWLRGRGVIFMLHHVLPNGGLASGFAPNAGLEVTPEYLDDVIRVVKKRGYALISLEEAADELATGKEGPPFAVFTLDDGYKDNMQHAWPVFRSHACPFLIFVSPAIAEGKCEIWWRGLEYVIANADQIDVEIGGTRFCGPIGTDVQKRVMFDRIYWPLRYSPEDEQRVWIRQFCSQYNLDLDELCRRQAMTWDDIRKINKDPLCSIGAHTVHHRALKKLEAKEALAEVIKSRDLIAKEIGDVPQTFAYPYGDETSADERDFELIKDAGFKAAVTTRKGMIFPEHKDALTALPRFSLNGGYQEREFTEVLLTGMPFAVFNGLQRITSPS
jgi:peptidoglycan/xylan/chitin deacetylase (PgdA/CDA1 family)